MLNLQVLNVSTRPGRKGPAVGEWMHQRALAHGAFAVEVVHLAALDLPVFDEPEHPRLRKYVHEHTRQWSATVERADAFVFVTPEYNFSTPAPLLNALTYLYHEWTYKPVAFASYGGASGGMRGVQMTKQLVTTLKLVPLVEALAFPLFAQQIDAETGVFNPGEKANKSAAAMLDELHRWAVALKPMRG
ncbi:MAG: NADPH-dependent FMN reductase [Gemmatimonadaceae bacterium]